jgi:cytochrome P450
VYHNEKMDFYAMSRFDDVLYGLLHPQKFMSSHGITLEGLDHPDQLLNKDDPEHLVDKNIIDVVDDFSTRMPMVVICNLIGIPEEYREQLLIDAKQLNVAEETDDNPRPTEESAAASMRVHMQIAEIVEEFAQNPTDEDNVMNRLLTTDFDDLEGGTYRLRPDQVTIRLVELMGAGFETTARLIANAVVALAWYPDQRAELANDPGLHKNAVEEIVRWDPSSHFVVRFIEEEHTAHGVTIPADSRVVLLTASANHDERVFDDPELFDIHRKIDRHVGFAFGTHLCLGAAIARMETRVALQELLARYPHYELSGPIVREYAGNVRGLSHLPIVLDPSR